MPLRAPLRLLAVLLLVAVPASSLQHPGAALELQEPTVVHALAVAETPQGFVGSLSTVSITVAREGSGHVFLETSPLAQVDMQGSARLAVRVAAAVTGLPVSDRDYFFVVRSEAPVVGGPSAGGIITVGVIAALMGWPVNQSVMMTGTINPDGDVGPIGGLLEKIDAAADAGATLFLYPEGQERAARLTPFGLAGAPVVVEEHCARIGIRCVAVGHVEEAVRYATGHAFEARPSPGNVTSQDFLATMRPLASNLTTQARALVTEVSAHFDRAARALPGTQRELLRTELSQASHALLQAEAAYGEGRYYTASSRSYQASLQARTVAYTLGLYEAADRDAYVQGLLDDAAVRADGAVASAQQPVLGATHLEGLGAAQERASEAERAASSARAAYQQGDALAALRLAAQARERSASVAWWLEIGRQANADAATEPLDAEVLNRTARDLVDTAREAVVYADLILQQGGGDSGGLAAARELLARAEADLRRGFVPAAIFEALQAEVRASVSLELAGSGAQVQEAKLQRARERAAAAIVQARADGLEPLLAQSYFEFAGDLTAPEDALAFYNTARSVATLGHTFFEPQPEPRASRFVGFAPVPERTFGLLGTAGGASVLLSAFFLGLAVGGGVGLAALLAMRRPAPQRHLAPPPATLAPPPQAPPAPPVLPAATGGSAGDAPTEEPRPADGGAPAYPPGEAAGEGAR